MENLDATKDELVRRLQGASHEKMSEGQEKAVLANDIGNYKRELLVKD